MARVRVGSVGLWLVLELGLGLWFGLKGNAREGKCSVGNVQHSCGTGVKDAVSTFSC